MALNQVTVTNPSAASNTDGTTLTAIAGRAGETMGTELHGKWYNQTYRGAVYTFGQVAVALPFFNSATLASVFTIVNPTGSGKNMELISFDLGSDAAATVINTIGLYYQSGAIPIAALNTLTAGTVRSGMVGSAATGVALAYTAAAHVGVPTRYCILSYFGASTTLNATPAHLEFDGRVIVPPGTIICVATSTTISTAVGLDVSLAWAEVPV